MTKLHKPPLAACIDNRPRHPAASPAAAAESQTLRLHDWRTGARPSRARLTSRRASS